jgi:enoyl-CoA hydratase/carnithine racemase
MAQATQNETSTLRVERPQPHVALVTLDRPQVMNAIDSRLAVAIEAAVRALDADPDVRVVVLTGAGGRAFSAGADLKEMVADPSASRRTAAAWQRNRATQDYLEGARAFVERRAPRWQGR